MPRHSNSKKRDLRVTITSTLPEFKDHLSKLVQLLVQPDITWLELLMYHNVPINTDIHQIKSSKNTAYLDEQIQNTALHFARGNIRAQLVNLKQSRVTIPSLLVTKKTGVASRINAGQREPQIPLLSPRNGIPARANLTASPKTTGNSKSLITHPKRGGAATKQKTGSGRSGTGSTARIHQPAAQNGTVYGLNSQIRGELNLNVSRQSRGTIGQEQRNSATIAEDPIIGGPVGFVLPRGYAESQASQDSQPADISVSHAKQSLIDLISRRSNQDVGNFLQEIKNLKSKMVTDEQSCYRWQKKTPQLAHAMFNWADCNP